LKKKGEEGVGEKITTEKKGGTIPPLGTYGLRGRRPLKKRRRGNWKGGGGKRVVLVL